MRCWNPLRFDVPRTEKQRVFRMWEQIRALWRASSIFIVGLVVIVGAIYLVGHLSSSTNPAPAASSDQAASPDQGKDQGNPAVPSTATPSPSPQGGGAKQSGQQLAQSNKAPSEPPARQDNPAPAPQASAKAAAPSPAPASSPSPLGAASQPAHDHMAASSTPSPNPTTGQSPAPPVSNAPPPASNVASPVSDQMPAAGDASAGRLVFRKCQACHSIEPGKNLLGPSLAGVIGRKAGTEAGYNYSPAMKSAGIVWNAQTLDQYLTDPAKVVPGNKMPFPGLKTDHDRADVIAYLAGGGQPAAATAQQPSQAAASPTPQPAPAQTPAAQGAPSAGVTYIPDARYTLRTGIADGRMAYIGQGGEIDGKVNPVLTAVEGQVVQLTLINGEGAEHDIVFRLFLQRPRPSARRHAGSIPGHPAPATSDGGGSGYLAGAQ
jgi:nitrite reductase (NO-forming)